MTPYTATDLIRSMNHAYGESILTQNPTIRTRGSGRFISWVRTFLHLS